jgi:REP element-mobilizing transposase RayT
MKYASHKHHRRSIRLKGYDYSEEGGYFVTICTHNRECLFGEIVEGEMRLNEIGKIVKEEWLRTPIIRENVEFDEFVIMPNHLHCILFIVNKRRGVWQYTPTKESTNISTPFRSPSKTIGAIVRGFKSATTKRVNEIHKISGIPLWQRNYYEHIIRNEEDLNNIRTYIDENPTDWYYDKENPENVKLKYV